MPHMNGLQPGAALGRLSYVHKRRAPLPILVVSLLMILLLSGCANGGTSALADVFTDAFAPPKDQAKRAADLPFASLSIDTDERSGLIVLGASSNHSTFWPTGHGGLLALRHDGLQATVGLNQDLLDTRYQQDGQDAPPPWQKQIPEDFNITRTWEDAEGLMHSLSADGQLTCGPEEQHKLPLVTLTLEPCALTLEWQDGSTTQGTLWRSPHNFHLWAVEEQPWPDGPTIRWEVARQWW